MNRDEQITLVTVVAIIIIVIAMVAGIAANVKAITPREWLLEYEQVEYPYPAPVDPTYPYPAPDDPTPTKKPRKPTPIIGTPVTPEPTIVLPTLAPTMNPFIAPPGIYISEDGNAGLSLGIPTPAESSKFNNGKLWYYFDLGMGVEGWFTRQ